MNNSIKREQSQTCLNSAERENSRTKCKVKIQTRLRVSENKAQLAGALSSESSLEQSSMLGDIVVRLYDETPIHRDNFVKLVKEGYYDGTLFHRVIKDFMIQGGDPDSKGAPSGKMLGVGGPDYTLEAEIKDGLFHKRGALAAARQGDEVNPERRSSGSQFYIVWGHIYNEGQLRQFSKQLRMQKVQTVFNELAASHRDEIMQMRRERNRAGLQEMIQGTATGRGDRPIDDIEMRISVIE